MTQQTVIATTPAPESTCAKCSQFNDYLEPTGKGWCNLFNKPARREHPQTLDCQLNLPTEEEDLPHAEYEPGQIVKVIDEGEDHTEWASFVVIGATFNQNRFRSTQAYLSEPDWNYLIASVDRPTQHQFWVAEQEICHGSQSHLIDTANVF